MSPSPRDYGYQFGRRITNNWTRESFIFDATDDVIVKGLTMTLALSEREMPQTTGQRTAESDECQ